MKDFMMIWNRLTCRTYSGANVDNAQNDSNESEDTAVPQHLGQLRRKSSVVVNRFFNASIPVDSNGTPRWPKRIFVLLTLSLVSLMTGCLLIAFNPYELIFKWKLIFAENGEIFEIWRKPDVNLYVKIYLFNVTNRDEYMSGKESKLRFQEVGPYVYREYFVHENVTFNDNGTISAIPIHPLEYKEELSNGKEDDLLILPNIALLSITNVMRDASYLTRWGLNVLIRQTDSHPLVQMTAKEFMFGYKSALVTLGNNLMPSWIKFDKLGLIDRMYDFDNDFETIYTGENDVHNVGLIEKYNGDFNLPQWQGKCGNVMGSSDGVKFPSYIEPNDTLLFFRKSLCRSAPLYKTGEKTIKGLHTYKYNFMEDILDNGAVNPENKCFCREGNCLKPGLIDVTDCYYGFPIALSYPHFYKSDPSILESVEGLDPQQEHHESYFYIEPKSGLPVSLAARFQINMMLQNIGHMARVEKFEDLVLPLLWFEIGINELPTTLNVRFWVYLVALPVFQDIMTYMSLLFGIAFLFWSIFKVLLPQGPMQAQNWWDAELEKKQIVLLMNRRPSSKISEMDTYYCSLLGPKEGNIPATPAITTELSALKEEIA